MKYQYVIVGAGLAGVEAAASIRKLDGEGTIVVVGEEPHPFYTRIRLPEVVAGTLATEKLTIKKPSWYEAQAIVLRLDQRVETVDGAAQTVTLSDSSAIGYDRLLLATGARPFIPPITGADKEGVLAIRTIADAIALRERCQQNEPVVFVGGGLLGLEMAAAAAKVVDRVTVVEVAPWLLVRQVDQPAGQLLQSILETQGLRFFVDQTVEEIVGAEAVEAVRLSTGETLPASTVVVSAGIRANTGLARAAGCEVAKGVIVDDHMKTSVEGIFAAGDCVEHTGKLYGSWAAAEQQGRVAGTIMAGGDSCYQGTIPSKRLKVSGVELFSAGDIEDRPSVDIEVSKDDTTYRKLVRSNGTLVGAILVGDLRDQRAIAREIAEGRA